MRNDQTLLQKLESSWNHSYLKVKADGEQKWNFSIWFLDIMSLSYYIFEKNMKKVPKGACDKIYTIKICRVSLWYDQRMFSDTVKFVMSSLRKFHKIKVCKNSPIALFLHTAYFNYMWCVRITHTVAPTQAVTFKTDKIICSHEGRCICILWCITLNCKTRNITCYSLTATHFPVKS
jgi:hypothetical protein